MDSLKSIACDFVDSASSTLSELSLAIWKCPELSNEEFKAHDILTHFLQTRGFTVQKKYLLETGFRATYTNRNSPTAPHVVFLCEYDALPGLGHACGHNLITEVGIGAALAVKALLEQSPEVNGKVTVLGTPAEETTGGKIDFVRGGAFDDADVAIMSHPAHYSAAEPKFLALQDVEVTYTGKASHAASNPWDGLNALDASVMAYSSVSCLRQQVHESSRIHGIIKKGGEALNIIPKESVSAFCIRASNIQRLVDLRRKVEGCFRGAALATDCEMKIDWASRKFLPVEPDPNLVKIYTNNSLNLGTKFTTDKELLSLTCGSTDMGNVSHVLPSIHPCFNIGGESKEHTSGFAEQSGSLEAQTATLREAKVQACVALELLCQPELVEAIKKEFVNTKFHQQYIADNHQ